MSAIDLRRKEGLIVNRLAVSLLLLVLALQGVLGASLHMHLLPDHTPGTVAHGDVESSKPHLDRVDLTPTQTATTIGDDDPSPMPGIATAPAITLPDRAALPLARADVDPLIALPAHHLPLARGPPTTTLVLA